MNSRGRFAVSVLCVVVLSCCEEPVGMKRVDTEPCLYCFSDLIEAYEHPELAQILAIRSDTSKALPEKLKSLPFLRGISWNTGYLMTVSSVIGNIPQLEYLFVENNKISNVLPEIRKATKLEMLDLHHNQLTDLPDEICELYSLNYLNLSVNNISRLPDNIHKLWNLKTLYIKANPISKQEIERIRRALPNLKYFYHD
ncbi:MAG: hypothetical protein IPP94_07560 [Ignavibacteria bacterium]|nr:hypothetical protein [Ignavibacteria bacterium]